ncbi:cmgc/cdk/pitslre protein kinase [Microthyrium microscopicum]|uniref:cyclin-dependent kinase n=1 Tax=Microthyrium microscopicum TaxID=703497 RepID=A0A6A6U241_9PEZI|nr:cmgc/cdk/pitslre protein kinase [Microthyrium microscopicum]
MTGSKSRWADDEADKEARRREKEEKKRAKLAKQKRQEEEAQKTAEAATARAQEEISRPAKRRRISNDDSNENDVKHIKSDSGSAPLLRFPTTGWSPSRNVSNFESLNHIEEGSYGWVSRAKETATGEIVALKKMKMDTSSGQGFPVDALREIQILSSAKHRHIVDLREVVVGDKPDDVYLVMQFLEHDLKTLQEEMAEPFLPSEIKTLLLQIVAGVEFLHDNWILHRDLKTSNILMNNRGEIKLADFGMARQFSDPPPANLTQLVVTLWYRAPELLFGTSKYGTAIDMWSIGCIFGELVRKEPLLQGRNEVDQLRRIFLLVGTPDEDSWPGFRRLAGASALKLMKNSPGAGKGSLRAQFPLLTSAGASLLAALLSLNPDDRPSAQEVLSDPYFLEAPRPKTTAMFPTFPSKAGGEKRRRVASPNAPQRGQAPKINMEELSGIFSRKEGEEVGAGFALRMA